MNTILLSGTVSTAPEIRYSKTGFAFAGFVVNVTVKKKLPDGQWSENTEPIPVKCSGKNAEALRNWHEEYGTFAVVATGKARIESFKVRDGNEVSKLVIQAEGLTMVLTESNDPKVVRNAPAAPPRPAAQAVQAAGEKSIEEDDVPF